MTRTKLPTIYLPEKIMNRITGRVVSIYKYIYMCVYSVHE